MFAGLLTIALLGIVLKAFFDALERRNRRPPAVKTW